MTAGLLVTWAVVDSYRSAGETEHPSFDTWSQGRFSVPILSAGPILLRDNNLRDVKGHNSGTGVSRPGGTSSRADAGRHRASDWGDVD